MGGIRIPHSKFELENYPVRVLNNYTLSPCPAPHLLDGLDPAAGQDVEQGGLAGTRGTDDGHERTSLDVARHALHHHLGLRLWIGKTQRGDERLVGKRGLMILIAADRQGRRKREHVGRQRPPDTATYGISTGVENTI